MNRYRIVVHIDKFIRGDDNVNDRDLAYNIVSRFSDEQLRSFITLFRDSVSEIPNDETIAAMEEAEQMFKSDKSDGCVKNS